MLDAGLNKFSASLAFLISSCMVVLWVLEGNESLIKNLTYTRRVTFSFILRVKLRLVKTLHAK